MKINVVYIKNKLVYANRKDDLIKYCNVRHGIENPNIRKISINDEVYQELISDDDTNLLVNLKETEGYPLLLKEFIEVFDEGKIFNHLVYMHHHTLLIENDIKNYTKLNIFNIFIVLNSKFHSMFKHGDIDIEKNLHMYYFYSFFIYDKESDLLDINYSKRRYINMSKREKIEIIERFVKKLEYDYNVLKRTSEVIVLSDNEKELIDKDLKELKKTIKKIKECKTFDEINKYIKVKRILKETRW